MHIIFKKVKPIPSAFYGILTVIRSLCKQVKTVVTFSLPNNPRCRYHDALIGVTKAKDSEWLRRPVNPVDLVFQIFKWIKLPTP